MINETEELVCRRLGALSFPTRLEIVKTLQQVGPQSFEQLCNLLEKPSSHLSHHLKILKDAGVVDSRKNGRFTYYQNVLDVEVSQLHHLILRNTPHAA